VIDTALLRWVHKVNLGCYGLGVDYRDLEHETCSIARPIFVLGERWTLIVLRQAFLGSRRFEEFHSSLGISRSLLADRLGTLVAAGILERRPYRSEQRTRLEYRLTAKGRDLWPVLMALRAWGDRYMAPDGPFVVYRHRDCEGVVDVQYVCAGCGQQHLSVRDVVPVPGPGAARANG
jgi:DNA-binding HxlR family transcriptional regulator